MNNELKTNIESVIDSLYKMYNSNRQELQEVRNMKTNRESAKQDYIFSLECSLEGIQERIDYMKDFKKNFCE